MVKIQRPEEVDIKAVEFVNKKHKSFQTIVEPHSNHQVKTLKKELPKTYEDPKTGERKESNPWAVSWKSYSEKYKK